jgi:hypothetical protein
LNGPKLSEIWKLADELRRKGASPDSITLAMEALERGIQIDLQDLRALERRNPRGGLTPDDAIIRFFASIAAAVKPKSVLDPWAGIGHAIDSVINALQPAPVTAVAIAGNPYEVGLGKLIVDRATWIVGDPFEELQRVGTVDLIVSCPPFGYRAGPRDLLLSNAKLIDDYGNLLIAKACIEHLSPNGVGVFVVPPSFFLKRTPQALRNVLPQVGLSLSAAIHVPSGYWQGTIVESYIVILDRARHTDLFVAEINRSDEHNQSIVRNLFARRSGADLTVGHLADANSFTSYRELASSEWATRLAHRMGVDPLPMAEAAIEINLTKKREATAFPDRDNAVYVPLIGNSRTLASRDDLSLKAHNYAQIVLDPSKALAPFVAGYFNSPIGRAALDSLQSGAVIPHVTKGALLASQLFLPTLSVQTQCIQAESHAANLASELAALRAQIWDSPKNAKRIQARLARVNHEETLFTWMDALPFPLASILWAYHASGSDDKAAYEHLLHFFEAFAEFQVIVLWSSMGAARALRDDARYPLRPEKPLRNSIEKSTFGTWVELGSRLSKFGRSLLNGNDDDKQALLTALGTRDLDVLGALFSPDIVGSLQKANGIRNATTGHGGIVGRDESERRRVLLENVLAEVRATIGDIWLRFPLMKAGAARFKGGVFTYEAERIMGRSSPFQKVSIVTSNQIEDEALFLFAEDTGLGIALAPMLLVGPSPDQAHNACYFYNRVDGDQVRFVSYHFEKVAEIHTEDPATRAVLKQISETFLA